MSDDILKILFIGLAGVSTGIGALPVLAAGTSGKRVINNSLAASAGIMLTASFFSLILPGLEAADRLNLGSMGASLMICAGLFIGFAFVLFLHNRLPHEHFFKEESLFHREKTSQVALIIFAIALHNFPEGLAVGVGFGGDDMGNGILVATAIIVQNLPEGFVVAVALAGLGHSRLKAVGIAFLTGFVEPVAAGLGFAAARAAELALPVSMAFAAGAMIFVVLHEMIPEIMEEENEKEIGMSMLSGVCIMIILGQIFE